MSTTEEDFPVIPWYKKLIPLVLLVLTYFLFFQWIPIHVAEEYSILFAIVGGIISVILSFWTVIVIAPVLFDKLPIVTGILCISTLFIFGYQFIVYTTDFYVKELQENGIYAKAVVVDKTQIHGRRGRTIESIDVAFFLPNKKRHDATISISRQEYQKYYRGMKIPIYYSSKHPSIARIAYEKRSEIAFP
jgi:hypothetical protein